MIIAHHFAVHSNFKFPADSITVNNLWKQFISLGTIGDDIFVLISGYFLIKSREVKKLKIFDLWLRMFFYSVVFFAIFVFSGLNAFSWLEAIKCSFPVVNVKWWFMTVYFVLYLVHPYLNILLNNLSREEYKKFLILIFTLLSVIPSFASLPFVGFVSNSFTRFISIYSLAGYFRLYGEDFEKKKFLVYGVIFLFVNFLSAAYFNYIGWKNPYFGAHTTTILGIISPFTILAGLCFLLGFRGLHIKNNKFINTIAAAMFGVYLIHENSLMRPFLWQKVFKNASFQNSPYLIPYSIGVVILVFVVCTLIELVRSKIFKIISRGRLN